MIVARFRFRDEFVPSKSQSDCYRECRGASTHGDYSTHSVACLTKRRGEPRSPGRRACRSAELRLTRSSPMATPLGLGSAGSREHLSPIRIPHRQTRPHLCQSMNNLYKLRLLPLSQDKIMIFQDSSFQLSTFQVSWQPVQYIYTNFHINNIISIIT